MVPAGADTVGIPNRTRTEWASAVLYAVRVQQSGWNADGHPHKCWGGRRLVPRVCGAWCRFSIGSGSGGSDCPVRGLPARCAARSVEPVAGCDAGVLAEDGGQTAGRDGVRPSLDCAGSRHRRDVDTVVQPATAGPVAL